MKYYHPLPSFDALATFLLLAYTKLLSVFGDLLTLTQVFNVYGKIVAFYVSYAASIEYFDKEHISFILALTVVFFLILLPMAVLTLYPTRCFRKCHLQPGTKYHVLYIFLNSFHGCYMDGRNGTRDTRYFAGVLSVN